MDRGMKQVLLLGAAIFGAAAPAWAGGFTQRVSVSSRGEQGTDGSRSGIRDRHLLDWALLLLSRPYASNLVPGDTKGFADAFVRDRLTGRTERVSVGLGGATDGDLGGSQEVFISADARVVVYETKATNLVAGVVPGRFLATFCLRPADPPDRAGECQFRWG